jgi:hypothetical protein
MVPAWATQDNTTMPIMSDMVTSLAIRFMDGPPCNKGEIVGLFLLQGALFSCHQHQQRPHEERLAL